MMLLAASSFVLTILASNYLLAWSFFHQSTPGAFLGAIILTTSSLGLGFCIGTEAKK